jgi:peptidoglycan hydrolase CwlO-like protein
MKNDEILEMLGEIKTEFKELKEMMLELKHDYQTTKNTITQLNVRISEKQAKLI